MIHTLSLVLNSIWPSHISQRFIHIIENRYILLRPLAKCLVWFYDILKIFQSYHDLEAGYHQSLKSKWRELASQELNHSINADSFLGKCHCYWTIYPQGHILLFSTVKFDYFVSYEKHFKNHLKELPRVNRTYDIAEDQKVNFLVFLQFYLNFVVFLSNFIKTYILLNFIHF